MSRPTLRRAARAAVATGAALSIGAATASAAGESASAACPSAATMSAKAGASMKRVEATRQAELLLCNYNNVNTGTNVVVDRSETRVLVTRATFIEATDRLARISHAHPQIISGFGTTAIIYTEHDASTNVDHVATSVLDIDDSGRALDLTGTVPVTRIKMIAHYLLSDRSFH